MTEQPAPDFDDLYPLHDFQRSLELSQQHAEAPWWIVVYRAAFPDLRAAVNVRNDGWAQRGGIDRVLTLSTGKTVTVDEKVRTEDWPDILLERFSDEAKRIPGWIQKPLACDFIAYAFIPSQTCYLLPTLTLQRAWKQCGRTWIGQYREIRARNRNYVTLSTAVPVDVLMQALGDAMRVNW